ncbi:MAG: DUF3306 domain-containing protein [Proteobacteria bacterium]|nr:DUF3306 domain-containing protein [Pseudomonadota bacterium]
MADPKNGFIERWSLRKRTARQPRAEEGHADQTAQAPTAAVPEVEPPAGPPSEAAGDPEVVAQLPDLDSLDDASDFSVFLKEGVPDVIRRKALRKLWRVNPVLACLDGLNDYDEDYTVSEALVKGLKTVYETSKRYLDEDETAAPEGQAAEAETAAQEDEAGEVPAATEASHDRERDSERVAEADRPAQPPLSTESRAPGPAAAAEMEISKPVRGSARKRRWGALDS